MRLRVLLLADTHLGFDLPVAPRIRRRRRGPDFVANHRRALEPALRGEVDLVVHAGDVFDRSRPHHTVVAQAFEPLRRVADAGVPVLVVPGNHERGRIPHPRFARHPRIHLFDRPRTLRLDVGGVRVALLGFPYERDAARHRFPALVEATGWRPGEDDVSLLCIHHCVEGATVGPADFTFRRGADVIRCRDIPPGVAAVLTGHVHRHQILTSDLDGRPLHAPVIYPGSVERTAFAEKGEPKGYVVLELEREGREDRWRVRADFRRLPTRPMVAVDVLASGLGAAALRRRVEAVLAAAPPDAVLRLRIVGRVTTDARDALAAATLRALAPDMNVDVVLADEPRRTRPRRARIDIPGRRTHEERAAHEPDLFGVVRPAFARRGRPPQRS